MTTVINIPPSLDDRTFEGVLEYIAPLPPDEKILIDTRHTRWASPYGLTALLALARTRAERPALYAPEAEETASYWHIGGRSSSSSIVRRQLDVLWNAWSMLARLMYGLAMKQTLRWAST